MSQQRGRGRVSGGRGRGAHGRGRGSGGAPLTPTPSPAVSSASATSAAMTVDSASSSLVSSLGREVEQRLTMQQAPAPAPAPTPVPAPDPIPSQTLPPASSKAVRFPRRPGFGTIGKKCIVKANHFLVQVPDKDIHHYDVSITPEITSKKVTRDVMRQLVDLYCQSNLDNRRPAYDGRKSLYTAGPLPFSSKEFEIKLVDNDKEAGSSKRRDRVFKVAIKFASKPDLEHLDLFLRGRITDIPQETIQALDVVLREKPSNSDQHTVVGRSFFSRNFEYGELGNGVQYWKGYYQSLRATQMGLSLNIDVAATSFYEPILVTEFIKKQFNFRDLIRPLSDPDRIKVKKALKGVRVELSHGSHKRIYKITGLSARPLSQLMFTMDDEKTEISVVQYFRQRYNVDLKYVALPALQAGSEAKPAYLPMEICKIAAGQRYSKKLNERQVTALLRATCQRPCDREGAIATIARVNDYNGDNLTNEFGIHVKDQMAVVHARVLSPPMLLYHGKGREATENPRMGKWNMINKRMINGGRIESWACVNFSRMDLDSVVRFCNKLIEMCNNKGMEFNPTPVLPIYLGNRGPVDKALRDIHQQFLRLGDKRKQLQLLIVILPDMSGSYGMIKRVCDTELGIVTQCCQPKQAMKLNMQYLENVSLKLNVKAGGRNTVLSDAIHRKLPVVSDVPTIILGADVTHPQPGEDSTPSIAAVVASMDWPEITKYRGLVSAQTHRQEIIQDLYKKVQDPQRGLVHGGMIRELFIAFRRNTGQKPHRVVFYRDGVSEGQFNDVLLYEMDAIRKACASLEDDYMPPVTFVVVQKRHHTRLFPSNYSNRNEMDPSSNILPGTVVDTQICHPTEFDFYLNSHAGIQGTSRPAHYHVLFDENKFTADALQSLTNNLCYTFARCTRSVSIVPPAYYAHLAAFRARYYLESDTSDGGSSESGRRTNQRNLDVKALPAIRENVKDVMFYC